MEIDQRLQAKLQSWWWRDFTKVCSEEVEEGWFQSVIQWKVGSGDKIRFWEDVWLGSNKLSNLFPRLFSLSMDKGVKWERLEVGKGRYGGDG